LKGLELKKSDSDKTEFEKCSSEEDYQAFIQKRSKFQDPGKVWRVLGTTGEAYDICRILATAMAGLR